MCGVIAGIIDITKENKSFAKYAVSYVLAQSRKRGRDGIGLMLQTNNEVEIKKKYFSDSCEINITDGTFKFIGNLRAEPTTEFVQKDKPDQDLQPYSLNGWHIVHNGTIANDACLRTHELKTKIDSACIAEQLGKEDKSLLSTVKLLKGSYAIIATHKDSYKLETACNYKPIYYAELPGGYILASEADFFPPELTPVQIDPYSCMSFTSVKASKVASLYQDINNKVLMIFSGGLDSTVCATFLQNNGYDVTLFHLFYGCKAQQQEYSHVEAIADYLELPLVTKSLDIYADSKTALLSDNIEISGDIQGAEYAHEWVPARNLLMMSLATSYAEMHGFHSIALGSNLEEAGAYPDNEPEFINKFNLLLPYAVNNGFPLKVVTPVGYLMKHEIVKLGNSLNAPMHLSWSCYRNGEKHCGKCGPCYMRKTAFKINNIEDTISYEDNS